MSFTYLTKLFIIVGLTLILTFAWVTVIAVLNWLKKFKLIWFLAVINPIIKLWLWFLLVWLWYKVFWAITAFVLASFIWFAISLYFVFRYLKSYKIIFDTRFLLKDFWNQKKDIISYIVLLWYFIIIICWNNCWDII